MKNWKTSGSAAVVALGQLVMAFGVTPEVGQAITTFGICLIGMFAGDSKK